MHPRMDNGESFMRAQRAAAQYAAQIQQQQATQHNPYLNPPLQLLPAATHSEPLTPGERPAPEDTTGLKMLEKFLTERRSARDDDERK